MESIDTNVLNSFHEFSSRLSKEMGIPSKLYGEFEPHVSLRDIKKSVFAHGASIVQYANVRNFKAIELFNASTETLRCYLSFLQKNTPLGVRLLIKENAYEAVPVAKTAPQTPA